MYRDIHELIAEYPPTDDHDPYISVIARVNSKELDYALVRGISDHKQALKWEEESRKRADKAWEPVLEHGQALREIYADSAGRLQAIERKYTETGLIPPADLMNQTFETIEKTDIPLEVLGLTSYTDMFLQIDGDVYEKAQEAAAATRTAYELAKPIRERRNRLGLPARMATWLAGALFMTGLGVGVSNLELAESSDSKESEVAEVAYKAGAFAVSGLTTIAITVPVANGANRRFAKFRAKRILNK